MLKKSSDSESWESEEKVGFYIMILVIVILNDVH